MTATIRRSKAQHQAVRAMRLAFILHRSGVTANDFRHGIVTDDQIHLAESIAHFETPASVETLSMCVDLLAEMDEIDPPVCVDRTPILVDGHFGYIGAANEDLDSTTPIKTSVSGMYDGRKVTIRVRLTQDGALELASRMVSVVRKVDAEKRAAATWAEMRESK